MAYCTRGRYYDAARTNICDSCECELAPNRAAGTPGPAPATSYSESEGPVYPQHGAGFGQPVSPMPPRFGAVGPGFQRAGFGPGRPDGAASGVRAVPGMGGTRIDEPDESPQRLMGFLVVVESKQDEEWRYIRLRKGVNGIGRFGSRAQVELRDQEASSEHALLICTNAAARIIDLDSSNGLFVNDERIEIAALSPGDIVRIGRTHLAFVPFPYMADD
jgi:hypothetical protein